jgi:hypothetical protein
MSSARARLGAAAIGDQVFVVGGVEDWLPWRLRDLLLGLGLPWSLFVPRWSSAAVEVYDARSKAWSTLPSLEVARADPAVGVLHDRVHVVGGRAEGLFGEPTPLRDHEVLTPALMRWETRMPLPAPRAEPGAAVVEGRLYVSGGMGPGGPLATVESYTPLGDTWQATAELPAPRHAHGSSGLFGDVFVAGGRVPSEHHVGVHSCPMTSTLFVHRKVAQEHHAHALPPGPAPAHAGEAAAGVMEPARTRARERRQDLAPAAPAPAPAVVAWRIFVFLAIAGLIGALVYGYWPGRP